MENQTDAWKEDAYVNLQQAIAEENWSLALDIIKDVRSHGYEDVADFMEKELQAIRSGAEIE